MAAQAKVLVFQGKPALTDLAIARSGSIGGVVLQTGGGPVADATVRLWDAAWKLAGAARTDAEGGYRFEGVNPGAYIVSVDVPVGFTAETSESQVELGSGHAGAAHFVMKASGHLRGRVVDHAFGIPISDVGVEVLDQGGKAVATGKTNEAGDYEFQGLMGAGFTVRVKP